MATLRLIDGADGRGSITGRQLLNEIGDLLEAKLPLLSLDDPVRGSLAAVLPLLSRGLGRPPVRPVPRLNGGE